MQIPQPAENEVWYFREMRPKDAQAIFEINSDEVTCRFTVLERQQSLPAIHSWIDYYPSYKRHGFGIWVIAHKQTHRALGLCGLRVRKDLNNAIDLSYRMHPAWRNLGIASKAVKVCVAFGFTVLKLEQILAQVHKENVISARILAKLGFEKGDLNGIWQDWILIQPTQKEK